MDLEADVRLGDFAILRRLGAGGMGIVYLARQVSLDRLVALKVLGPALNSRDGKARFQREAQAVARLNFPGIAQVHYVGQDRQICYIAMQYVDGISLREAIDRLAATDEPGRTIDSVLSGKTAPAGGPAEVRFDQSTEVHEPAEAPTAEGADAGGLTAEARRLMASPAFIRRCCEVVRDAALALAHAHERGVIHRDIKPENLLLDRSGRVLLIDFGIARFLEDLTLTSTGALIGTPMYMSPEQVAGRLALDHRTDIYSLGLLLLELLVLERPIRSPTREGLLRQIVTKALVPASWRNRAIPRDLESVVHRATAKDPDQRFQTAAEFVADLTRVLDGRAVASPPYRYRFDRRELVAERPRGMTFVAGVFFAQALVGSLLMLKEVVQLAIFGNTVLLPPPLLAVLLAVILYWFSLSRGILAGRRSTIPQGYAACSVNALLFAGVAFKAFEQYKKNSNQDISSVYVMIGFMYVVLSGLAGASLVLFARRATAEWFALAGRLRAEHRRNAAT